MQPLAALDNRAWRDSGRRPGWSESQCSPFGHAPACTGSLRFRETRRAGHSARQRRQSCCMNFETVSPAGLSIVRRLRACGGFRTEPWRMPAFLANTSVSMPVAPASIIEITEVAAPGSRLHRQIVHLDEIGKALASPHDVSSLRLNRSAGWSRHASVSIPA